MNRPTGLIVDFGGVLTTSIFDSFAEFCRKFDVDPQLLRSVLKAELDEYGVPDGDHPTFLVEKGQITGEEFNEYLATALSKNRPEQLDASGLKDLLFADTRPEPSMVLAIAELRKQGVATGMCSNSWGGDGYPHELFKEIFDAVVLSGEVGLRKPQPEIFRLTAEQLDREPSECVFIDDLEVNVAGAEAVGMTGIHHQSPQRTIARLAELFDLRLEV